MGSSDQGRRHQGGITHASNAVIRTPGFAATRAVLALVAAAAAGSAAHADAVADFYSGKELTIQVGFGAGGGYDTTTRLFARYFGKHIPGNPSIIV